MRLTTRLSVACASWLLAFADVNASSAQVNFNPRGRTPARQSRPAPKAPEKRAPRPRADRPPNDPARLIARYESIVLKQPGAEFPLERLVQLYRQRDGHLGRLVTRFEGLAAATGPTQRSAQLALAGIREHAGQTEEALELYAKILAEHPRDPTAATRRAHLLAAGGDKRGALSQLDGVLGAGLPKADRERALRTLMEWSLDLEDLPAARRYHRSLAKLSAGSFYARAELARLLAERARHADAEAEYRALLPLARGDTRTLVPTLRDLARALSAQGKHDGAIETLRRAEKLASRSSGLRLELLELLLRAHRAADRLPELVERLETSAKSDFDRLVLLARLHEELGDVKLALARYRAALKLDPRSISVRQEVIQLLQLSGELDEVTDHYVELTRLSPKNPEFAFRLAESYLQGGDRKAALRVLSKLESRRGVDDESLAALVEFYERIGERDRGLALLERLAKRNRHHVVELGDRYFALGDTERALETWQRIAENPRDADALRALGEVYLNHDLPARALAALERALALAPHSTLHKKSYALALERTGASASKSKQRAKHYREAQQLWEQLLAEARQSGKTHLAREARQHIVTLWSLTGTLAGRVPTLKRRLIGPPTDLEAGRLLAETELRLRRYADAEVTLRRIIAEAPGDTASHARLERALVQRGNLEDAIDVLKRLAELEPRRAREYYQRMATYAAELYQDDRALGYASRAVDLSPEDARGHLRLGEMYRERQDVQRAIAEFRKALSKNDRLFGAHFQLAELLLNEERPDEADVWLRRVLRAASDEELVARATRLSMQINLGRGTLESLEKELLPIALGNPARPVYRRLLVEIYGALAFPLISATRSPEPPVAHDARRRLQRIGQRAVKPLLDALGDPRDTQQRIAIELLSHVRNDSAGPALLNFAQSDAEPRLRLRAMLAAGALRDVELLDELERFVFVDGTSESDPIAVAAAWAISNLASARARPALLRLLDERSPTVRALALLGLARMARKQDAPVFSRVAASADHSPTTRAAAAVGLANLGNGSQTPSLLSLARSSDVVVRATAITSLVRLGSAAADGAIANALVSPDPSLVRAAVQAACLAAGGASPQPPGHEPAAPTGRVDVRALLEASLPRGCPSERHAQALAELAPHLAEAAARSLMNSAPRARSIENALLSAEGQPTFAPLAAGLDADRGEWTQRARAAVESIALAVVDPFLRLTEHPAPEVRQSAVRFLSSRSEQRARQAVLTALDDPDLNVRRSAIDALQRRPGNEASGALARLLDRADDWSLRLRATRALEAIGRSTDAGAVSRALTQAAEHDPYALVREAALRALHATSGGEARDTLARASTNDPEPGVRRTAEELLRERH